MLSIMLIAFAILMIIGQPIGFALGISAFIAILMGGSVPLQIIPQRMAGGLDSFPLLAVPFFMLCGELMEAGGLTPRLVRFATCLVGHLRGGLAHVAILASLIFAGISGSAVADATATGSIMVPLMKKRGYDGAYAACIEASSSAIGPILPPSILMIVYAATCDLSVGEMFLGGVLPGILIAIGLMVYNQIYSMKHGYGGEARASLRELGIATVKAIPALIMPAIILGGIISGVFTATEAGCVAAVYSAFVGVFVYRELKFRDLEEVFVRTASTTSMVMLILASCSIFSWILAVKQFPAFVSNLLLTMSNNPHVVLALIMAVLVIVGLFMETLAAAIILIPVLSPICSQFGFDPIHFAVVVVMTFILGTITPPVGVLLYITTSIAEEDLAKVARKIIIPVLIVAGVCVLAAYYPPVVTAIPNLFFK